MCQRKPAQIRIIGIIPKEQIPETLWNIDGKPCEALFGTISSSSFEESGSVSNRTGWSSETPDLVIVQASWLSHSVWKEKHLLL